MALLRNFVETQIVFGGVALDDAPASPSTYGFCRPAVLHFGDPMAEYRAASEGAAVFDVSDRTQIELRGPDAKTFFNGFCTNNIVRLEVGAGCEAFVTNVKGRVLAHVFAFVDDERVSIETSPGLGGELIQHLDRYIIRERVELIDRTEQVGELLVAGPASASILREVAHACRPLDVFQRCVGAIDGETIDICRVDAIGSPSYLVSADAAHLATVWKRFVEAGARPAGAEAFHALRIESSFPLYGLDITAANFPQEVDRDAAAISFTKGCYLGQEPIARIDAVGHVNRKLRRIRFDAPTAPIVGAVVRSSTADEIGAITSSARSPVSDTAIALALVRTSHIAQETAVIVESECGPLSAVAL